MKVSCLGEGTLKEGEFQNCGCGVTVTGEFSNTIKITLMFFGKLSSGGGKSLHRLECSLRISCLDLVPCKLYQQHLIFWTKGQHVLKNRANLLLMELIIKAFRSEEHTSELQSRG